MSSENAEKKQKCEETSSQKGKISLHPHLYFPGTASAAVDFYAELFQAKITMKSTYADLPDCAQSIPEDQKNRIMHASINWGDNCVMFCDAPESSECGKTTYGNNVQLSLNVTDVDETTKLFNALAEGGTINMPLMKQFWGAVYGNVTDRFGITWGLNCQIEETNIGKQEEKKD